MMRPRLQHHRIFKLFLLGLGVYAAVAAQILLNSREDPNLAAAAVLFLFGGIAFSISVPDFDASWPDSSSGPTEDADGVHQVPLAVATVLIVVAVGLKLRNQLEPGAFVAWLASIVFFLLAFWRSPSRLVLPRLRVSSAKLALAGIVVLAFALRWVGLETFPPNVDGDEAVTGSNARQLLYGVNDGWLGTAWLGFPSPSFLAHGFSMRLFGDNLYGLRMAASTPFEINPLLGKVRLVGRSPG